MNTAGQHSDRRGLTLVESLAAIVLLTILASALIPLLHESADEQAATMAAVGESTDADQTLHDLARIANKFIENPSLLGLPDETLDRARAADHPFEMSVPWSQDDGRKDIHVKRIAPTDLTERLPETQMYSVGRGAWLLFVFRGHEVARWIRLVDSPEEARSRPGQPGGHSGGNGW